MTSENSSPRVPARDRSAVHLGAKHPVAKVAGRHCQAHLGSLRLRLIGGTACGACWERAIRDDERAVVLFGLPRELERDPGLVDEIAVDLACLGERVLLTRREREEAVRRLTRQRVPAKQARDVAGSDGSAA